MMSTGAADAAPDVPMNPCGTQCGSVELCDGVHKGIDDNCDGQVDENCTCEPGQAESCFKGDPSYLNTPGCFPGTQSCTELGKWGPCVGGAHATDNPPCFDASQNACHAISALPYATVDLSTGLGDFGQGGTNETYTLDCPQGVTCPMPDATGNVQVIQSGEYTVTFTEMVNGAPKQCQYSLYVGARGLRVELSWDYPTVGSADLDLHVHEPGTTTDWANNQAAGNDCGWTNCKAGSFVGTSSPHWFPDMQAMPGSPVNWYKDPVMTNNTCYYAPRGAGQAWISNGMGCHNPRLDIDDITCDPSITDSTNSLFCVPENINIDFPPPNVWIRIGVNYYANHASTTPIHPDVKISCDGALAGELGSHGFYMPEAPDVISAGATTENFWPVGDVMVQKDAQQPVRRESYFTVTPRRNSRCFILRTSRSSARPTLRCLNPECGHARPFAPLCRSLEAP